MKLKNLFQRVFIDGLGGMGLGLFATLIIGTIIQQVGTLIGGTVGSTLVPAWKNCRRYDRRRHRCGCCL